MIPNPRTILISFHCQDCIFKSDSLTESVNHMMTTFTGELGDIKMHGHDIKPVATTPPGFKLVESRRQIRNYPSEGEKDASHTCSDS